MKYAGLDGVMVDWYGVNSDNSIALHKSNTEALFRALKRAGLKMSVVYEDRTLEGVTDKVGTVRQDLRYLAENFFKDDSYVKVEGRPLLLDFGPIQMESPKDWSLYWKERWVVSIMLLIQTMHKVFIHG